MRRGPLWAAALAMLMACTPIAQNDSDFSRRRLDMVERQIRQRGVVDPRVLDAMRSVPRERFVPADAAPSAYDDSPLSIGFGQTISQPYIVAYMSEALAVQLVGAEWRAAVAFVILVLVLLLRPQGLFERPS